MLLRRAFSSTASALGSTTIDAPSRTKLIRTLQEALKSPVDSDQNVVRAQMDELQQPPIFNSLSGEEGSLAVLVAHHVLNDPSQVVSLYSKWIADSTRYPSPMTMQTTSLAAKTLGDVPLALQLLEDIETFDIERRTRNIVWEHTFDVCTRQNEWGRFLPLLEKAGRHEIPVKISQLTAALSVCITSQEWHAWAAIVDKFLWPLAESSGDIGTLEQVLSEACGAGHHVSVFHESFSLRESRVTNTVAMFNNVAATLSENYETFETEVLMSYLHMLIGAGKWYEAMHLLENFDAVTTTTTNSVRERSDRFLEKAVEVYEKMLSLELPITKLVYDSLLQACGRVQHSDMALDLVREMQEFGHEPDDTSYRAAISAAKHHFTNAKELYQSSSSAAKNGVHVTTAYMAACAVANKYDESLEAFNHISDTVSSLPERTRSYGIIAHAKLGNLEEALSDFTSMKRNGLEPNLYAYAAIMDVYSALGTPERALMLYKYVMRNERHQRRQHLNDVFFRAAFGATRKLRASHEALDPSDIDEMYHHMTAVAKVEPSGQTMENLILSYSRIRQCIWYWDDRFETKKDVSTAAADTKLLNALLTLCWLSSRQNSFSYETMKRLETESSSSSKYHNIIEWDTTTYAMLIRGYGQAGKLKRGLVYFEKWKDSPSSLLPELSVYNAILWSLKRNFRASEAKGIKCLSLAIHIYDHMNQASSSSSNSCFANQKTFQHLLGIISQSSSDKEHNNIVLRILKDMKASGIKPNASTIKFIYNALRQQHVQDPMTIVKDIVLTQCDKALVPEIISELLEHLLDQEGGDDDDVRVLKELL